MKKFEVGERVHFIYAGKLRTGSIKKITQGQGEIYAHIKVDDTQVCVRVTTDKIAKLDQPEPVKVPEQLSKLLDTYLITKEPLDDFSKGAILADILDDYLEGVLAEDWELADNWIGDNRTKLIDAVRNGYVVEEEPKYYVQIIPIDCGFLNTRTKSREVFVSTKHDSTSVKTKFTEKQIKAIDERLWQFAVPVEEVEDQ